MRWRDWDDIFLNIILILLAPGLFICIAFVIVAPFWLGWEYFHPSETLVLPVSEWECTSTYQERVFSGKIWITTTKCSNYSRRGLDK